MGRIFGRFSLTRSSVVFDDGYISQRQRLTPPAKQYASHSPLHQLAPQNVQLPPFETFSSYTQPTPDLHYIFASTLGHFLRELRAHHSNNLRHPIQCRIKPTDFSGHPLRGGAIISSVAARRDQSHRKPETVTHSTSTSKMKPKKYDIPPHSFFRPKFLVSLRLWPANFNPPATSAMIWAL